MDIPKRHSGREHFLCTNLQICTTLCSLVHLFPYFFTMFGFLLGMQCLLLQNKLIFESLTCFQQITYIYRNVYWDTMNFDKKKLEPFRNLPAINN